MKDIDVIQEEFIKKEFKEKEVDVMDVFEE